ncbi:MAG: nucleoside recognition domain-containing protein, partial [Psychrilyobacter sp.]|uniref:nucleoside recognition domain-containing protein n=1 Tax=Psychrilyobacter sp. TaxID=2586924 RepID=UPI003C787C63
SYMAKFGKTMSPIMRPTGFGDRWEAVAAVIPSIAAKEVVVGFMAQVLPLRNTEDEIEEPTTFTEDVVEQVKGLGFALKDSFLGIVNISAVGGLFEAPDAETVEEQGVGVVGAVANLWAGDKEGPLKAYSFMVFILLVVPCIVTLAAIKHEFGNKFMWFVTGFLILVPYVASTLIYQIGRLFI